MGIRRRAVVLLVLAAVLLSFAVWLEARRVRGPSVLLITIDTLRVDRLGAYGAATVATPHIDRLAGDGVLFENAAAPMPLTLPSHLSLFSSRYPREIGASSNYAVLPAEVPTLTQTLASAGYDTAAFTAVSLLGPDSGIGRGFDTFEWPATAPQRVAAHVVRQATAWLAGQPRRRPFFVWVHLFDPHQPYVDKPRPGAPPRPDAGSSVDWTSIEESARSHGGNVPGELLERALRYYDAEVMYTDHWVGRLIQALVDAGRLDDTLIVLTADHGECFENGVFFEHASCLFDGAVRVPLILRHPQLLPVPTRIARQVELRDVAPTILALLGLEAPASFGGEDLLDDARGRQDLAYVEGPRQGATDAADLVSRELIIRSVAGVPTRPLPRAAPQLAVRSPEWKALLTGEQLELYRVGQEDIELSSVESDVADQLGNRLRRWHRAHPVAAPSESRDAESRANLRSLGYVN